MPADPGTTTNLATVVRDDGYVLEAGERHYADALDTEYQDRCFRARRRPPFLVLVSPIVLMSSGQSPQIQCSCRILLARCATYPGCRRCIGQVSCAALQVCPPPLCSSHSGFHGTRLRQRHAMAARTVAPLHYRTSGRPVRATSITWQIAAMVA